MAARTGGRTQQGMVPSPDPHEPGQIRPAAGSPPPGPAGAVPRTGGRTQQGARERPRTGGRTQQGTQGGREVPPGPVSSPAGPPASGAGGPGRVTGATVTQQGAGLLVAAFAWPLGVNLLKGGPAAMWGWVQAKFVNQPYSGPGAAPGRKKG